VVGNEMKHYEAGHHNTRDLSKPHARRCCDVQLVPRAACRNTRPPMGSRGGGSPMKRAEVANGHPIDNVRVYDKQGA
jgi:hypothetical protein